MNFQFYMEKLFSSEEFAKFKDQNKDAYLCSGFFSVDKKGKDSQQHLDFYIPSDKKMFSFQIEKGLELLPIELHDERVPEKVGDGIDFDFDKIEKMIEGKMFDDKINKEIQKILFSLQNMEGVNYLIGTIFISGMGILKVTIDLDEMKIVDFQKKSFFDMMKIIRK